MSSVFMEQAGRARIMRSPTATRLGSKKSRQGRARIQLPLDQEAKRAGRAAPEFVFQNCNEIEHIKPVLRSK